MNIIHEKILYSYLYIHICVFMKSSNKKIHKTFNIFYKLCILYIHSLEVQFKQLDDQISVRNMITFVFHDSFYVFELSILNLNVLNSSFQSSVLFVVNIKSVKIMMFENLKYFSIWCCACDAGTVFTLIKNFDFKCSETYHMFNLDWIYYSHEFCKQSWYFNISSE